MEKYRALTVTEDLDAYVSKDRRTVVLSANGKDNIKLVKKFLWWDWILQKWLQVAIESIKRTVRWKQKYFAAEAAATPKGETTVPKILFAIPTGAKQLRYKNPISVCLKREM